MEDERMRMDVSMNLNRSPYGHSGSKDEVISVSVRALCTLRMGDSYVGLGSNELLSNCVGVDTDVLESESSSYGDASAPLFYPWFASVQALRLYGG
jgi:hypothetical protein